MANSRNYRATNVSRLRLFLIAEQRWFRVWKPNECAAIAHHQFLALDQQLQTGTVAVS